MSGYSVLAPIYDTLGMASFGEAAASRLLDYAMRKDWMGRRILCLGCGTGAELLYLGTHRYMVTGIDNSPAMLEQARAKMAKNGINAPLLEQDIQNVSIDDHFDMIFAVDVLNELPSIRALETVFQKVNAMLDPGKLFAFDLHTLEGLAKVGELGERLRHDDPQSLTVVTRNNYDYERQEFRENHLIFRAQNGVPNGAWTRQEAEISLRAYPVQAVLSLLKRSGFDVMGVMDARFSDYNPKGDYNTRVFLIASKTG